jgi:hypothetical protein
MPNARCTPPMTSSRKAIAIPRLRSSRCTRRWAAAGRQRAALQISRHSEGMLVQTEIARVNRLGLHQAIKANDVAAVAYRSATAGLFDCRGRREVRPRTETRGGSLLWLNLRGVRAAQLPGQTVALFSAFVVFIASPRLRQASASAQLSNEGRKTDRTSSATTDIVFSK